MSGPGPADGLEIPEFCGLDANGLFSDAVRIVVLAGDVRMCSWTQRPVPRLASPLCFRNVVIFICSPHTQPACWGLSREGSKPLAASSSLQAAATTCCQGYCSRSAIWDSCHPVVCICGASCASSRRVTCEYDCCTRTCGMRHLVDMAQSLCQLFKQETQRFCWEA